MVNEKNRRAARKIPRRLSISSVFLVALVLVPACGGKGSVPSGGGPTPAAPGGGQGQVVITGAVSKTFMPTEVSAVKIGDSVGINVFEKEPCGVALQFPNDLSPGTYPMDDALHQLVGKIFGDYGTFCDDGGTYRSTGGTLKLTTVGSKFSGSFDFQAGNMKDPSKTVGVSGSFSNASMP